MKIKLLFFLLLIAHISFAQQVIQLYEGKPKGSENWTWSEVTNYNPVFHAEEIANVTQPTLLAYLPEKDIATGTAVIIAPAGGFHILSAKTHGIEIAEWLKNKGIAAFVLKHRLIRSVTNNPFQEMVSKDPKKTVEDNAIIRPLATADGLQAMKYIRDHAKEMNIDPQKIGFIGFSAGGTLAMLVACNATTENSPNFLACIYGDDGSCTKMPTEKTPIFLAAASDDPFNAAPLSIDIYSRWLKAKFPAELHIFERGGHAFALKKKNLTSDSWIERFEGWLKMNGYIK